MKFSANDPLSRVSLFAGLDSAVRDILSKRLRAVRLERGEVLFREGDLGAALFLVESGEVRVLSHNGTKEVCRLGPLEHVGEMSLIDQTPRSATVIAACDTALWQLSARDFDALCQSHPQIHKQIAIALAQRLRDTTIGSAKRRAESVVLLLDARHSCKEPDFVATLAEAIAATTHRRVASMHLGIPRFAEKSPEGSGRIVAHAPEMIRSELDTL